MDQKVALNRLILNRNISIPLYAYITTKCNIDIVVKEASIHFKIVFRKQEYTY